MTEIETAPRPEPRVSRRWTPEEDRLIVARHAEGARALTALLPGRAYDSVRSRMSQLGLRCRLKRPPMRWTAEEDALLRSWRGKPIKDALPKLPGREYTAVRARLVRLGVAKKHEPWTWAEDSLLREGPGPCEAQPAFYARAFPGRTPTQCQHRYLTYIAPLLGRGLDGARRIRTRYDEHVRLARSEQEVENLKAYYFSIQ